MLVLTKDDIKSVFTMKMAIDASKQALSLYSSGKSDAPLRTIMNIKDKGKSLFMPAYVSSLNANGIKIISLFPKNNKLGKPSISSKMFLLDDTGEVCAMLDGAYLTQLRTGALQGVATDLFARQQSKISALFGAGAQAATQLEAMINVRQLSEVRVFDINLDRAQSFVSRMQKEFLSFGTKIIAVKNADEAIKDADIITAVTTSEIPVFDADGVKQGVHINGIGAYLPHMQELPDTIIHKADKIIFDTKEGVLAEAGDILIPLKYGLITENDFTGELGEVLLGKVKSRQSDDEITVFKAVGSAVLDVVTAHNIYTKAMERNIGKYINM